MESQSVANQPATAAETPVREQNTARGGRGNSRRGGPRNERGRGDFQRRSGRGGRGARHGEEGRTATEANGGEEKPAGLQTPGKKFLGLQTPSDHQAGDDAQEDGVEADVCFICASNVVHNSIAPCNHRTCHICALRLRALYKTKQCAHCRTNSEFVIFTDDSSKRFEDFKPDDFSRTDANLGIKYEKDEIFEDTVLLLRYNCPEPSCDIACYGWPGLHKHVKSVHHKVMCDLCTRNKKVFTHEHDLFTQNELRKHERFGDDNPGAVDQSGFRGHPECGFCRQRFYGDDELYTHCREKHERCFICDQRPTSQHQDYYLDYNALETHFRKDHFLCPDQECLDKKFVVFGTESELKIHQVESHPNGMTKDARRDARRVDMSGYDYHTPHQEVRRGGRREGRGRGRGRDPNMEPLPVSSAQPMRRDEMAYQRQMAIHSAQSVSNRTFGGELTSSGDGSTGARAATTSANEPSTVAAPRPANNSNTTSSAPAMENLSLENNTTTSIQNLPPEERARYLRHASVTERASNLLGNSSTAIASFRERVSQYTHDKVNASQLIDSFFTLFDTSSSELGTLIKELADIFESQRKRDDLLKAWNDWRAINEDYPSLPGPQSGVSPSGEAGSGGKRILKLKSSTAQSSRSAVGRNMKWGNVARPSGASSSGGAFPPIGASSSSRPGSGAPGAPRWVTSSATPSSSSRNSPVPTTTTSAFRPPSSSAPTSTRAPGADAFPALPAAQKPGMPVSRPGYAGNPVLKASPWGAGGGTATTSSSWGRTSSSSNLAQTAGAEGDDAEDAAKKGKGKGKKGDRQTLFHWG